MLQIVLHYMHTNQPGRTEMTKLINYSVPALLGAGVVWWLITILA